MRERGRRKYDETENALGVAALTGRTALAKIDAGGKIIVRIMGGQRVTPVPITITRST